MDSGRLSRNPSTLDQALAQLPRRLERLKKSCLKMFSRFDQDARFLRPRGGHFVLGYTAEIAVLDDHLIVALRVSQNTADNRALLPMLEQAMERCEQLPEQLLADSGYFSNDNLEHLEQQQIESICLTRTLPGA
jgi:hypothetical protein